MSEGNFEKGISHATAKWAVGIFLLLLVQGAGLYGGLNSAITGSYDKLDTRLTAVEIELIKRSQLINIYEDHVDSYEVFKNGISAQLRDQNELVRENWRDIRTILDKQAKANK